jgi:hypothetical protein
VTSAWGWWKREASSIPRLTGRRAWFISIETYLIKYFACHLEILGPYREIILQSYLDV